MPHNRLLSWFSTTLALAIITSLTSQADSNAQETLQPYAPPILHSFLDSANVYPESVTVLKLGPVEFFVAETGAPLRRISVDRCYEFWESEVRRHLLSPHGRGDRSKLPDEYGYLASEWSGHVGVPIVLLEKIQ